MLGDTMVVTSMECLPLVLRGLPVRMEVLASTYGMMSL